MATAAAAAAEPSPAWPAPRTPSAWPSNLSTTHGRSASAPVPAPDDPLRERGKGIRERQVSLADARTGAPTPLGRRRLKATPLTPDELSEFGPLGGPAPDVSDRYLNWESRPRRASRMSRNGSVASRQSALLNSDAVPFPEQASTPVTPRTPTMTSDGNHMHNISAAMVSTPQGDSLDKEGGRSPQHMARMASIKRKRLSQYRRGEMSSFELQEFGPLGGVKRSEDVAAPSESPASITPTKPAFNEIPTVARRARLSRAPQLLAAAASAGSTEAQRQLDSYRKDPNFSMADALTSCGLVEKWDIHGNPYDLKDITAAPCAREDKISGGLCSSETPDAPIPDAFCSAPHRDSELRLTGDTNAARPSVVLAVPMHSDNVQTQSRPPETAALGKQSLHHQSQSYSDVSVPQQGTHASAPPSASSVDPVPFQSGMTRNAETPTKLSVASAAPQSRIPTQANPNLTPRVAPTAQATQPAIPASSAPASQPTTAPAKRPSSANMEDTVGSGKCKCTIM